MSRRLYRRRPCASRCSRALRTTLRAHRLALHADGARVLRWTQASRRSRPDLGRGGRRRRPAQAPRRPAASIVARSGHRSRPRCSAELAVARLGRGQEPHRAMALCRTATRRCLARIAERRLVRVGTRRHPHARHAGHPCAAARDDDRSPSSPASAIPIGSGFAKTYAAPGGNITGLVLGDRRDERRNRSRSCAPWCRSSPRSSSSRRDDRKPFLAELTRLDAAQRRMPPASPCERRSPTTRASCCKALQHDPRAQDVAALIFGLNREAHSPTSRRRCRPRRPCMPTMFEIQAATSRPAGSPASASTGTTRPSAPPRRSTRSSAARSRRRSRSSCRPRQEFVAQPKDGRPPRPRDSAGAAAARRHRPRLIAARRWRRGLRPRCACCATGRRRAA